MELSTPPTTKRRATPNHPSTPPDSELLGSATLVHGDDPEAYERLRAKTHDLSGPPDHYNDFLADVLASSSWEFARTAQFRTSALNLQIADDWDRIGNEFEAPTAALRQYLAWKKVTPEQGFQTLLRDTDRHFRRIHQTHNGLLDKTNPER